MTTGLTEKIIIHVLSGLQTSVRVQRGKGGQQGAVKYSIQFKWKPATFTKTHKLRNRKKHFKQSSKGGKRRMPLRMRLLLANNQATRRNKKKDTFNWFHPATGMHKKPNHLQNNFLGIQKQLPPTDPILGPGKPSQNRLYSGALPAISHELSLKPKRCASSNLDTTNFKKWIETRS